MALCFLEHCYVREEIMEGQWTSSKRPFSPSLLNYSFEVCVVATCCLFVKKIFTHGITSFLLSLTDKSFGTNYITMKTRRSWDKELSAIVFKVHCVVLVLGLLLHVRALNPGGRGGLAVGWWLFCPSLHHFHSWAQITVRLELVIDPQACLESPQPSGDDFHSPPGLSWIPEPLKRRGIVPQVRNCTRGGTQSPCAELLVSTLGVWPEWGLLCGRTDRKGQQEALVLLYATSALAVLLNVTFEFVVENQNVTSQAEAFVCFFYILF